MACAKKAVTFSTASTRTSVSHKRSDVMSNEQENVAPLRTARDIKGKGGKYKQPDSLCYDLWPGEFVVGIPTAISKDTASGAIPANLTVPQDKRKRALKSPALSTANLQILVPLGTEVEEDESVEHDAEETTENCKNSRTDDQDRYDKGDPRDHKDDEAIYNAMGEFDRNAASEGSIDMFGFVKPTQHRNRDTRNIPAIDETSPNEVDGWATDTHGSISTPKRKRHDEQPTPQRPNSHNWPPHAPGAISHHQTAGRHNIKPVISCEERPSSVNEDDASDSSSIEDPVKKCVKRRSHTPYTKGGKSTQLKFYAKWGEIFELAKQFLQLHLATKCAFPERGLQFSTAADCITKSIVRTVDDEVEKGFYLKCQKEMGSLVFEEGSTFCAALKAKAREVTKNKYDLWPPSDWDVGNQAEFYQYVQQAAGDFLAGSKFLHCGQCENGRSNNFNHPAVEELYTNFFFGSPDALGVAFPEEFRDGLDISLALVCAALHCSLSEYNQGGGVVPFSASPTYRGLTNALMTIIQETKWDPYHGPKLKANLHRWAQNGRARFGLGQNAPSNNYEIRAYLD
ncbi:hypothetical protein PILCRDRAFT_15692 [Piloderma croceum F 1598]|uniref:DUF6532 domain-containing protein n=1 Tax=Piloderma croceum (strain F 1598) TaxID=765440 RepID=A0A0C3EYV4_PILCF|nr:hypothetical protein PILCRDRAFT_15692 [Piloderma croceum F 1598]